METESAQVELADDAEFIPIADLNLLWAIVGHVLEGFQVGRLGLGLGLDILNIEYWMFIQLGPASPNPATYLSSVLSAFCLPTALLSGCLMTNTTITSPEPMRTVRSILVLGGMGQWSL